VRSCQSVFFVCRLKYKYSRHVEHFSSNMKNSKTSKYYSLLCNSYTLFSYLVDEVVSKFVILCICVGKMVGE